MRVLVTGGAGYIGSFAVRRLIEAGHEPVVLDDLSRGHRAALPAGVRLVERSFADSREVAALLGRESIEAVLHFAGRCVVDESVREPLAYHATNLAGGIRLLEACLAAGVRRFVFSSSAAVYGAPGEGPVPEDSPLRPVSPYGRAKRAFEEVLSDLAAAGGFAAASLRYFNAAGAAADGSAGEDHRPETHLVPRLLAVAARGDGPLTIHGGSHATPDGTCVRDYVHVADLAEAHRLALAALEPGTHRIYNVGSGRGTSVRDLLAAARRVTGCPIPAREGPPRAGDPPVLVACTDRIRRELGWSPASSDTDSILASAWRWHRAHPEGYGGR